MLFNSPIYIFAFLPLVWAIYFSLSKIKFTEGAYIWLIAASLFFYGYWLPSNLILFIVSISFNFYLAKKIRTNALNKRLFNLAILILGITFNLSTLITYKYADFLISSFNLISDSKFNTLNLMLPLAISFYTFQQIGYLIDCYNGKTGNHKFREYILFVSFFPQLIAGPIVRYCEMIPQFRSIKQPTINWENVGKGILIFSVGLFKKIVIADTFALWADSGFASTTPLSFLDAWCTSLSFTFQIYYDFSGYTDMAIGSALAFNIKLIENFNSPFKAKNIFDFWRRWHISLSSWFQDYLYYPLGLYFMRRSMKRIYKYAPHLISMGLIGFWHGANWTFLIWGLLHGLAMIFHKVWSTMNIKTPRIIAILATFMFVNITFIIFRSENISQALNILNSIIGVNEPTITTISNSMHGTPNWPKVENSANTSIMAQLFNFPIFLIIFSTTAFFLPNLREIIDALESKKINKLYSIPVFTCTGIILGISLTKILTITEPLRFLYFEF